MKSIRIGMAAVVLTLTLTACGNSESGSGYHVNQDKEAFPEAIELYNTQRCLSCHATDLEGNMGSKSNLSQIGSKLTKEELIQVISEGRKMMPAYADQLSAEQIEMLAEWLSTKS
ncbi:c-type cytochrome [Marinicrinis sediminis]|uniref:C-type cytochrome n=1 Tax=Marinicrinis sediminis TaxID=1652465 RepID=A0ABW5RES5_9BACL